MSLDTPNNLRGAVGWVETDRYIPLGEETEQQYDHEQYRHDRFLTDVALWKKDGVCALSTSLDSLYTGTLVTSGIMFSVTAKETLEILTFEFANFPSDSDLEVEIYTRQGKDYLTVNDQPNEWFQIMTTTTAVESADGLGSIVPRASVRTVQMVKGESRSFYFTLTSQNLQLEGPNEDNGIATGKPYLEDNMLQIDAGVSLRFYPFPTSVDKDRAFQGKIHYRSLQDCESLLTSTEVTSSFAVTDGAEIRDINLAFTNDFVEMLKEEARLRRWTDIHGLKLDAVQPNDKGSLSDCKEYGFENGCTLIDTTFSFSHYGSLTSKALELEMMSNLIQRNGIGESREFDIIYAGDQVLKQLYVISLTGVPPDTILNPFQRDYVGEVTFNFLETYSDADPYLVEIQSKTRRNLQLRAADEGRELQGVGLVQVEATVYGIGDDLSAFREDVEGAFKQSGTPYKDAIARTQYLPGKINENEDFGAIFANLLKASVTRDFSNDTVVVTGDSGEGVDSTEIQIIVFSGIASLSFIWLAYRLWKDCLQATDGVEVKNEKLSDRLHRKSREKKKVKESSDQTKGTEREELKNMDAKPTNPKSRMSNSFHGVNAFNQEPDRAEKRSRKPPTSRNMGRTKSADGVDFFAHNTASNSTRGQRAPPERGVRKSNTFSGVAGFFGNSESIPAAQPSSSRGRATPARRGVGSSKSSEDLGALSSNTSAAPRSVAGGFSGNSDPKPKAREAPAMRGIGRAKSADNYKFFNSTTPQTPSSATNRREPTRGVRKSNTFSGVEGFFGSGGAQKRPSWTGSELEVKKKTKKKGVSKTSDGKTKKKKSSSDGSMSSKTSSKGSSKSKPKSGKSKASKSGDSPKSTKSRKKPPKKKVNKPDSVAASMGSGRLPRPRPPPPKRVSMAGSES